MWLSDGSGVVDVYAEVVFASQQVRVQSLVQADDVWIFDTTPLEGWAFQAYIVAVDAAGNQTRLGPFEHPQAIYLPLMSHAPIAQRTIRAR